MGFVTGLVVGLHFAFLVFVLVGGYLAWIWPRMIWAHLMAGVWIILIISGGPNCPLTWAEHWARTRAGEVGPVPGFIDRYVEGVFFPLGWEWLAQILLALVILVSWVGFAVRLRRRRAVATPA